MSLRKKFFPFPQKILRIYELGDDIIFDIVKNKYYYEIIYYYSDQDITNQDDSIKEHDNEIRNYEFESSMRARNKVMEYGLNNTWSYFITITFDDKKVDINNSNKLLKDILQYFSNYKKNYDIDFKYILLPELVPNTDRLHFHGLVFLSSDKHLKYLFYNKKYGTRVYRNEYLYKKFGANQYIKIKHNTQYISYYICKYINKNSNKILNRYYFSSKSLKTNKKILLSLNKKQEIYDKILQSGLQPKFKNTFLTKFQITHDQYNHLINNEIDFKMYDREELKKKFKELNDMKGI